MKKSLPPGTRALSQVQPIRVAGREGGTLYLIAVDAEGGLWQGEMGGWRTVLWERLPGPPDGG